MKSLTAVALMGLSFGVGVLLRPPLQTLAEQFTPAREARCLAGTNVCVGQSLSQLRLGPKDRYVLAAVSCEAPIPHDLIFFPDFLGRGCLGPLRSLGFMRGGRRIDVEFSAGRVSRIHDYSDVTLP